MAREDDETPTFITLTARDMWDDYKQRWEKLDDRVKRLEIVVSLIAVYALGQGGASFLSRIGVF